MSERFRVVLATLALVARGCRTVRDPGSFPLIRRVLDGASRPTSHDRLLREAPRRPGDTRPIGGGPIEGGPIGGGPIGGGLPPELADGCRSHPRGARFSGTDDDLWTLPIVLCPFVVADLAILPVTGARDLLVAL